jgi:predicted DNA-binding transcriptional regulator YafY
MTKSSNTERAKRINTAIVFLKKFNSLAEAAVALSAQYGISKRQAYRYMKEAESAGREIPVPDQKIAFTVKLSQNLTLALRQYAQFKGQTLSEVVTQALEALLYKGRRRG